MDDASPLSSAEVRALRRRLWLCRLALLWERAWAVAWLPVALAGAILALALSDLLPVHLPGWPHLAALVLLGGLWLATAWSAIRGFRLPTAAEAAQRLQDGAPHRPLDVLADHPALPGKAGDPLTASLWRRHRTQAAHAVRALRAGWPRPVVAARDPRGLRVLPVLALVVAGAAAWGEIPERLARFILPEAVPAGPSPLVEAWLTPPAYTGGGQLYRTSSQAPDVGAGEVIRVPEGTRLLVLIHGARAPRVTIGDQTLPFAGSSSGDPSSGDDGPTRRVEADLAVSLLPDEALSVHDGRRLLAAWPLAVTVDMPPIVTRDGPFEAGARDRLRLPFSAVDDHGIAGAWLAVRRDAAAGSSPALPPQRFALPLPASGPRVSAVPSLDLTAHRWAGLRVEAQVVVRDAKGQEGATDPVAIVLPERLFTHPVAQALAGLRRDLIERPEGWAAVALGLDGLSAAPDAFAGDLAVFLGLRVAAARLRAFAATQAEGVGDLLWSLAERVEDGGLGEAEQALSAARQAVAEALRQGADRQTLRQKLDALRQAMRDYLRALAERMPELADSLALDPDGGEDLMDAQSLDSLIDQMAELGDLGAQAAAEAVLRRLNGMLDALSNARPMPRHTLEALKALGAELKALAEAQDDLLQQSFEHGRQEAADLEHGRQEAAGGGEMGGGEMDGAPQPPDDQARGARLAERQEALRRRLGDLMGRVGGATGGAVPPSLGAAELAMRRAAEALAGQAWNPAVLAQGEALKALRQGGQEAARQLMRSLGGGMVLVPGGLGGGTDPLGRAPGGTETDGTRLPTRPEASQAREVIEELRRRYGETGRPTDERDYLRRLLRAF